jgi:hypothetical protein
MRDKEPGENVDALRLIRGLAGEIITGAGSVVGYHGVEEPDHSTEKLNDHVEIRRYGPRIAAETTVAAGELAARNAGFRRLARYIFGANHADQRIAMTAPVAQQPHQRGEQIAMTAPVSQEANGTGEWVIRFFMPADKSLDNLPAPDDGTVRLVSVPPQTIAVRRFTGSTSRRAVASQTTGLLNALRENGFEAIDTPSAWFYDPPWTVPALRRNEIAVPVQLTR